MLPTSNWFTFSFLCHLTQIRLKVGGESYVTKKKTLARVPSTLFSHLLEADKLIDIPKVFFFPFVCLFFIVYIYSQFRF